MSLVETLAHLVDIPSVTGDEAEVAGYIEERFDGGRPVLRLGNAVVVGLPDDRPFVALYGHTDTVPEQDNHPHHIADGRMFGLGTSDMKAGLAVMIHLLEDVLDGRYDVVGVFYDREEGPADENGLEDVLDGAGWLSEAALSIVTEPTDLRLEVGCNGVLNADIVFTGHAAHSARPWLGENAITKAGRWLASLHERQAEVFEVGGHQFREVFSVTKAQGGIANNVIPATFTINLNHRFPPVFDVEEAEKRLRAVAEMADEIVIRDRAPGAGVPDENEHLLSLAAIVTGGVAAKQGWTDVARLGARGIPAVNYGPGEVAQAHQRTESVALANLDVAYDTLARFLSSA